MNTKYRQHFNDNFSVDKYNAFIDDITDDFNYKVTFRIGETPFFITNELKAQLLEGCQQVIDFIKRDDFKTLTNRALELNKKVPNEDNQTTFLL